MAEKKDTKPTETQSTWAGILKLIQTFVPAIGVFGALCYFLGRLYVESYYAALGIAPAVLTFDSNDYMFSSFNMVIMCLVFSAIFYICWEWFILTEKTEKTPFEIEARRRLKIMLFAVGIWVVSAAYLFLMNYFTWLYVHGLSGLATGLLFGILVIALALMFNPQSRRRSKKPFILILTALVIFMLSVMPTITRDLAEAQAYNDMTKFSPAVIISKDAFPEQLLDESADAANVVEGQMVITNNGMTYLLKSDNITDDEIEEWKVYAIPVESIQSITYISANITE